MALIPISLREAEWKLELIDNAVKEGFFTSRAEAYRTGALFLLARAKFTKYSFKDFDVMGLQKPITDIKTSIEEKNINNAIKNLEKLNKLLIMQSCIMKLVDSDQYSDYDAESINISSYRDILINFDVFDNASQEIILEDLKRDIDRLSDWIKILKTEKMEVEEKASLQETLRKCLMAISYQKQYIKPIEKITIIDEYKIKGEKYE